MSLRRALPALLLLAACEPIVAPAPLEPACVPQSCPYDACGERADGCGRTIFCACAAAELCTTDGTCVPCGGGACAEGACGEVIDACGASLSCGACAQGQRCVEGSCAGCAGGVACPDERACLGLDACSEVRGCERSPRTVDGFERLPPQGEWSTDHALTLEVTPDGESLWLPYEAERNVWGWARAPLPAPDAIDPTALTPIAGLPTRGGKPPNVASALGGAELWECFDPDDPAIAPTWALFVPDGLGGFVERVRTEASGGRPIAPQFLADGRTAIVAIDDERRLAITRRSAAVAELLDFGAIEHYEPSVRESGELLQDARVLCGGRLLLLEVRNPDSRVKRHLEVAITSIEPFALGAAREVPLPGISGLDLAAPDACDRFYQWRSLGLTLWRPGPCR